MSTIADMNESRKAAINAAERAEGSAPYESGKVYAAAADAYARIYAADVDRYNGRG